MRCETVPPTRDRFVYRPASTQRRTGDTHGPARRHPRHRIRRTRPGTVLRHAAGRHGRRSGAHRPQGQKRLGGPLRPRQGHPQPRPARHRARPQAPGWPRHRARSGGPGRGADRGFPPRRDGAPRPRTGDLPGAQSASGIRPHDRLGPERAAGPQRRPRHQLPRPLRRARCHRPPRFRPGAAAQPGGGLRRRRDAAGGGRARCGDRSARLGQGPGGGCRDDRRLRAADGDELHPQGDGPVATGTPEQSARRRRPLLRQLCLQRRKMARGRADRAAVLRPAAAKMWHRRCALRAPMGPCPMAGAQGGAGGRLRNPHARRMVRHLRR